MYVQFENMPEESRIWIYQSDQKFSEEEKVKIEVKCSSFLQHWISHGKDLKASCKIFYNQFLIVALDENYNLTSGCSIDSQVRFIKEIESDFNINLLDKSFVAFYINQEVRLIPVSGVKTMAVSLDLTATTLVFNNLIERKKDLNDNWLVPAGKTWINRYFKSKSIV